MSVNAKMTAIADAIRLKTGSTGPLTLDQMADDLNAISERDGTDLIISGATVTVPAGNYQSQVSGSVYTATQATPSITINASGLITATATQTAGYVTAGTKSATQQLAFQSAKTITPGTASQTAISKGTYATGSVIVKGDSNLKASNIVSGVSIFGISGTYAGGDTDIEDGLVTRALTSYSNSRITTVGSYGFYSYSRLQSIDCALCRIIYFSAFQNCTALTTASFPSCISIYYNAFQSCTALTTISFPSCRTIYVGAFSECTALTVADFPSCTYIDSNAFYKCTALATANFPNCTRIGSSAFKNCTCLTTTTFPACSIIHSSAFENCTGLTTIDFPACTIIHSNAFKRCSNIAIASFPACASINSFAFTQCSRLSVLYLAGSSLCRLIHSNAFSSTIITSTTGSIYVPLSLGWSYKNATNWTYFSNRIFSIEGDEIVDPDAGGDDIGGGGTGELITFTITIDEYEAEDGMTWREWVRSDYNTAGIYISSDTGGVLITDWEQVCDDDFMPVYERDLIIADMRYDTCPAEL